MSRENGEQRLKDLEQLIREWEEKMVFYESELLRTSSPEQKFELHKRIKECQQKIKELEDLRNSWKETKELRRCILVDPMSSGHYPTISEAISSANRGDKIIVRPGLYQEELVIDKPLEISGEGTYGEVVVEAFERNTLYFSASFGRVTNLTLRQRGGEEKPAINITNGRLVLEECDVTSKSIACVFIQDGADPILRRNRIHDGEKFGIIIINGRGILEDNEIFGNAFSGIKIARIDKDNPILRGNHIYNNRQDGVYIDEHGQVTLEKNNKISGNGCSGVHILNGGGTVEDCDIFGNGKSGDYAEVSIQQGGNLIIKGCKIHDAQNSKCIWVDKGGKGTIEKCKIFGSKDPNVWITNRSSLEICECDIYKGHSVGVVASKGSLVTLKDCHVFGNRRSNIYLNNKSKAIIKGGRVYKSHFYGAYIKSSRAEVEGCEIFENALDGVKILNGSNLKLNRSHVYGNGGVAVGIEASAGVIQGNDLRGNKKGSFAIFPGSWFNVTKSDNQTD